MNLFGEGGNFAPRLKNVIEKALEAKMEAHLEEHQRTKGNKRNGKGKKTLKSGFGTFDIDPPQDCQSSFALEFEFAFDFVTND
jgi:transposase-like protein